MRAMVLAEQGPAERGPLKAAEVPVPEPGPGMVRVRVEACGVCRTDLHIVEGDLPLHKRPVVPGHQVVGVVDAVGEEVEAVREGMRVGIGWLHEACGTCRHCAGQRENLCERLRCTGWDADGGYAEYIVAPAGYVYTIGDDLAADQVAPLLCAGIIGYRALRLAEIRPGARVGLYGFGASAHIALQVLRHWGCETYVFSRGRRHREVAGELGATWTGSATERPPVALDSAVIFAPAGWVVREALGHLDRGGTCAVAGIWLSPIPELDYEKHLYQERTLRSVTASTRADARDLLRLAGEVPIRTHVQTYPLERANEALVALKQSRLEAAAVLVV